MEQYVGGIIIFLVTFTIILIFLFCIYKCMNREIEEVEEVYEEFT